jgi:hypothetical protein
MKPGGRGQVEAVRACSARTGATTPQRSSSSLERVIPFTLGERR